MASHRWMCSLVYTILFVSLLTNSNGNENQQVHRRFEYKYSFKPPYLAQKDGTVPFWEYGGSKYTHTTTTKNIFKFEDQPRQTEFY